MGEVAAQLGVGQRVARGRREGPVAGEVARPRCRRRARGTRPPGIPRKVLMRCSRRISARCTGRTPVRRRDRPPPMCMRQEASPAVTTSARVVSTDGHLVGEHRGRGVGVLDRERAAEAAARVGGGQLDEVDAAHRAQQLQRAGRRRRAAAASGRWGGRSRGAGRRRRRRSRRARRRAAGTARRCCAATASARTASASSPARRASAACWWRTEPAHDPDGATTASQPSARACSNTSTWWRTSPTASRW